MVDTYILGWIHHHTSSHTLKQYIV